MKKLCTFCGNKNFVEKNVQYIYKHDDRFLVVNNVPCEECSYCGEQYFKVEVLKRIENSFKEIHFSKKKPKKKVMLPIEDYLDFKII